MIDDDDTLADEQADRCAFPLSQKEIVLMLTCMNVTAKVVPTLQPELRTQANTLIMLGKMAFGLQPLIALAAATALTRGVLFPKELLLQAQKN